jgi:hypothetical protein
MWVPYCTAIHSSIPTTAGNSNNRFCAQTRSWNALSLSYCRQRNFFVFGRPPLSRTYHGKQNRACGFYSSLRNYSRKLISMSDEKPGSNPFSESNQPVSGHLLLWWNLLPSILCCWASVRSHRGCCRHHEPANTNVSRVELRGGDQQDSRLDWNCHRRSRLHDRLRCPRFDAGRKHEVTRRALDLFADLSDHAGLIDYTTGVVTALLAAL